MSDASVRLSLVARVDGIAAGFITARADFGDAGRVEPVAVLDTIGVDPEYVRRGVGHALLSQLFAVSRRPRPACVVGPETPAPR
ncbi:MAG: GNAT family N-acetyltransferase [Ramlibacter sp.]